jgi:farnesyl-diphosphate farnesyltransferase
MFRYEPILKSVSRSFYLSLQILPRGIRPVIGLGYLLCRAADTMADTPALPYRDRLRLLTRFRDTLDHFPASESELIAFVSEVTDVLTSAPSPSEKALLRHLHEIVHIYQRLSLPDQSHIQQVVRAVIHGMTIDLETFPEPGEAPRALKTTADLENYLHHLIGDIPVFHVVSF